MLASPGSTSASPRNPGRRISQSGPAGRLSQRFGSKMMFDVRACRIASARKHQRRRLTPLTGRASQPGPGWRLIRQGTSIHRSVRAGGDPLAHDGDSDRKGCTESVPGTSRPDDGSSSTTQFPPARSILIPPPQESHGLPPRWLSDLVLYAAMSSEGSRRLWS